MTPSFDFAPSYDISALYEAVDGFRSLFSVPDSPVNLERKRLKHSDIEPWGLVFNEADQRWVDDDSDASGKSEEAHINPKNQQVMTCHDCNLK